MANEIDFEGEILRAYNEAAVKRLREIEAEFDRTDPGWRERYSPQRKSKGFLFVVDRIKARLRRRAH